MNMQGAVTGMIAGLLFTAAYIIYFKFLSPGSNHPDQWFMGISPEGIGFVGMLLNMVISLAVSRITPPPPAAVMDLVEDIRVPKGSQAASSH